MCSTTFMVTTRLAALWHAQASAAGGEALARLASARAVLQKRATRLDQQCAPHMWFLVSGMPIGMASGDKPCCAVGFALQVHFAAALLLFGARLL